jgi:adenylosuccinate synthase
LDKLCTIGKEYGTTTGRKRIVNYLNVDKLIKTVIISGTTNLIISKVDVAEEVGVYKFWYKNSLVELKNIQEMKEEITKILMENTDSLESVYFSGNPKEI